MLAGTLKRQEITRNSRGSNGTVTMTDLQSDIELMDQISRRDENAFHELYAVYGQPMYAYAVRITSDAAQAEDVVQDSLVTVWNTAGTYRGSSRLKTWLLGIVHHTAVKSLRHLSNPITDEMEETVEDGGTRLDDLVQNRDAASRLKSGLEQLSPEHRAVLDLVFFQGLNLKETADVIGCPVGTVKSRLSYARTRLKGLLSGMEDVR